MAKVVTDHGQHVEVQLATRIPAELARRLRVAAAQHGKLVGEIVREAIEPVVAKLEREARG